uniref:MADS-box protein AGL62 n=1 Tax=Aquilegia coerulea TaxID=218851 RepID=K7X6P3_AQUCA|nr:MADS-box protein AGL62 [Aquilegia coerulea]
MGKRKIEIKEIDNKKRMNVTFTKRRQGLFKKAFQLSTLCNAQIAILVYSASGKPYLYGNSAFFRFNHQALLQSQSQFIFFFFLPLY